MKLLRRLNALKFFGGDEFAPIVSGTIPASIVRDVFESLMTGTSHAPHSLRRFYCMNGFQAIPVVRS
jgi:hypothetical protein